MPDHPAPTLIAVATKGAGRIDQHFGHARDFAVYEAGPGGVRFVENRAVVQYCQGEEGEEDRVGAIIATLSDCAAVLVARIGGPPRQRLIDAGIEPVDRFAFDDIAASAAAYYKAAYYKKE